MLARATATVEQVLNERIGVQEIVTEFGSAFCYSFLTGSVSPGDQVVLNRTATLLGLGTGGYDFVMGRLTDTGCELPQEPSKDDGHIVKLRYTPLQHTVKTLEEAYPVDDRWGRHLVRFPVVACQLHSQIAPVAAALTLHGKRCAYIMTDSAALPIALSKLVGQLKDAGMIGATITTGQAFGGDYDTVNVYTALIAAARFLDFDAAIVCQGPGNTGTDTRYGFSGIEQAAVLDAVAYLKGVPIAVLRASSADSRKRHLGVSHHSLTVLDIVTASCQIAVPAGANVGQLPSRHDLMRLDDVSAPLDLLKQSCIEVKSMGRGIDDDPLFFEMAAAAGLLAVTYVDAYRHTDK